MVRWQASGFVSPFEFKLGQVNAIHWTPAEKPVKPEGEYCFELSGADVVFGTLASLDETGAVEIPPDRARLQGERGRRVHGEDFSLGRAVPDLVYLGLDGAFRLALAAAADYAPIRDHQRAG